MGTAPAKTAVEAAKLQADELHKFAGKKSSVHKDIEQLVVKI